jgi:cysteine desulfurase
MVLMIYLDHSATTHVDDDVMDTFIKANTNFWGNPSSLHNFGALAEQVLIKSSRQILDLLNANAHQVVFTSGATESNNLAIKGLAARHPGGHIITTKIEHPSVYEVCLQLEKQGYRISYLDVTKSPDEIALELASLIHNDTFLVSCMHVNSEMGLVLPIKEIGDVIATYPKVKYHVDAVQSIGKFEVDVDKMNIDLLSISAHKIHGIKGVGALVMRQQMQLISQIDGGKQMNGMRSGTVNVAGAASLAKALRLVCEERRSNFERINRLYADVMRKLSELKGVQVNSHFTNQSPYIVNFCVHGIRGETLVHALEEHDVYISAKSACASKKRQASYVLLALGFDETIATESVRVSFSHHTTREEVDKFIVALEIEIEKLKR